MEYNHPTKEQIPALWALWQEAFGDEDEYLDIFYSKAFSPSRCLCKTDENGRVLAALYWFDCSLDGEKLAYVFGVAVAKSARGQGLCRNLLEATFACLQERGYLQAVLVPARAELYAMYEKLGFTCFGGVTEREIVAGKRAEDIREISEEEYLLQRERYLPKGGVLQGEENVAFLAARTKLYAGDGFVMAYFPAERFIVELLGGVEKAPQIACALGVKSLKYRTNGSGRRFAMYHPLREGVKPPNYFGLPFDF